MSAPRSPVYVPRRPPLCPKDSSAVEGLSESQSRSVTAENCDDSDTDSGLERRIESVDWKVGTKYMSLKVELVSLLNPK